MNKKFTQQIIKNLRYSLVNQKSKPVSTLSPLASAFNKLDPKPSPTKDSYNVGLFGITELQTDGGFQDLRKNVLKKADELVSEAISLSPSPNVVSVFDSLSNELCKVADLAEFIRLAHPVKSFAKAAEETSFEIGGYVEKLNTHYQLYKAIQESLIQNGSKMDDVTKMVAQLFIFDFEQSGIHLKSDERKKAVQFHEAVLVLGARFTEGTGLPREFPLNNWPKDLQIPYEVKNNNIIVDSPYNESVNSRLREMCHRGYMSDSPEQSYLFDNLLYCRDQLSKTLGFESYAHRTLNATMATNPNNVVNFLERTLDMLEKPLEKELNKIITFKKRYYNDYNKLQPWDMRYYSSLISTQMYNISANKIKEYFSIGSCMEGLNIIFTSLYGVSLNVIETLPGEVWALDVTKLEVRDEKKCVLGYIYCDFYQRDGKLPQDCHFTIRGGKLLDDTTYQTPIISLNCNFPRPSKGTPSLLSQGMVENLFHEMGHAMHSMLGRARYQHVTGTRCATDFAEVPSILMEYFAMDPRILPLYAKHYSTGESLPHDIITNICASRKLFSAVDLQVQTFYSLVDQKFHGVHPLNKPTNHVLDDLHKQYSPLSHVPGTSWHLRFSHFHSYGAKYYAYVWSKAVASKIWYSCFEKDPLSRSSGDRYRNTMLQHGGGIPPQQLVDDMLGRNITVNDLVLSLENDLSRN